MGWPFFNSGDCDEDTREYLNDHCREGVDPRTTWYDFGDMSCDHKVTNRDDVHYSTPEETEEYYNQLRPSGWWVNTDEESE
jgi:hypothetical protein